MSPMIGRNYGTHKHDMMGVCQYLERVTCASGRDEEGWVGWVIVDHPIAVGGVGVPAHPSVGDRHYVYDISGKTD